MPEKIIEFETYCHTCKHYNEDESDPKSKCWHCLDEPVGIDSKKPVNYEKEERY